MAKDKLVAVIAIAVGHDGTSVRQPGDEFMMPESLFVTRPKRGADGKATGENYPLPSWFKRKSSEREAAVRLRTLAMNARVKAEAAPGDKAAAKAADDAWEAADAAEAKADAAEAKVNSGEGLA